MAKVTLSAKRVQRLLKKPGKYRDTEVRGLLLVVASPTSANWTLRYEKFGVEHSMGLGSARELPLRMARDRARQHRLQLLDDIDPLQRRRDARNAIRRKLAERVTFRAAAVDYHKVHADTWKNRKTRAQFLTRLNYVSALADVPLEEIDTALINETLAPIWNRIPNSASRIKATVARVLQWVKDGRPLPQPKSGNGHADHHPALPYGQLGEFLADLRTHQGISARALEFTILTCVRTSEATGARWRELDLEQAIWEIPAARMKSTRPHRVPLADAAVALLEALPREEDNPHVFIGMRAGTALTNSAMLQTLRNINSDREGRGLSRYTDPKQDGRDITVHGFRSTFRDWVGECTSFDTGLAEAALHHKLKSGTEAAYARGDLFAKRGKLMASWSRFCAQPTTAKDGEVVVPLRAPVS